MFPPQSNLIEKKRHVRSRRSGHLTAEALIVIPILLLISIAVVEFGLVVSLKQSAMHAAIRAVREGSKGATPADLDQIVEDALSGFDVTLATNAGYVLEDPEAGIVLQSGAIPCTVPTASLSNGNMRVTVCVNSSGSPVSGLITKFGAADLMNKIFTHSAVSKKECP